MCDWTVIVWRVLLTWQLAMRFSQDHTGHISRRMQLPTVMLLSRWHVRMAIVGHVYHV